MRSTSSTKSAGSEPVATSALAVGGGEATEALGFGLGGGVFWGALAVEVVHATHNKRAK
jgi:hypothetical protein